MITHRIQSRFSGVLGGFVVCSSAIIGFFGLVLMGLDYWSSKVLYAFGGYLFLVVLSFIFFGLISIGLSLFTKRIIGRILIGIALYLAVFSSFLYFKVLGFPYVDFALPEMSRHDIESLPRMIIPFGFIFYGVFLGAVLLFLSGIIKVKENSNLRIIGIILLAFIVVSFIWFRNPFASAPEEIIKKMEERIIELQEKEIRDQKEKLMQEIPKIVKSLGAQPQGLWDSGWRFRFNLYEDWNIFVLTYLIEESQSSNLYISQTPVLNAEVLRKVPEYAGGPDSGQVVVREPITVNVDRGFYFEHAGGKPQFLIWSTESLAFKIACFCRSEVSKDELIKIAESLRPTK